MMEIKKIEVDKDSIREIARFLSESFPKTDRFTEEFVCWQYAENPLGAMEGFNAWGGDRIISHFAGLPIEMNLWGSKRRGLLCINVSTKKEHRGKMLFSQLGQKTVEYASEEGYDFLIAVPNGNSSHAFLKYFGFYRISQLDVKVGIGANIYREKVFNCFKTWDDEQWKWRLRSPINKYYYKKDRIYSPISFFAKTISEAESLENLRMNISNKMGIRPLNLYIGLGADTAKGIYLNMPSFIKRSPFNLVFKDLRGDIPKIEKEDIFLQLIDLDTI